VAADDGGYRLTDRSERAVRGVLAAAFATIAVELADGGPPEWAAAAVAVAVAARTDSVVAALSAGVGTVVPLRAA